MVVNKCSAYTLVGHMVVLSMKDCILGALLREGIYKTGSLYKRDQIMEDYKSALYFMFGSDLKDWLNRIQADIEIQAVRERTIKLVNRAIEKFAEYKDKREDLVPKREMVKQINEMLRI